LGDVDRWAIQLQGLERPGAIRALVESDCDLVVLDVVDSVRGMEKFDTRGVVAKVKKRGRICLAYLNVGQTEDYRTDFDKRFALVPDPEGWRGDYVAAYWKPEWKALVLRRVDAAIARGFDGVYLDWVLAFEYVPFYGRDGRGDMKQLIREVARHGRKEKPGFLVLMQNGVEILPALRDSVDGYVQECVSFRGEANAEWDAPDAADIPIPAKGDWSTETMLKRLRAIEGVPLFTIDYATKPENIALVQKRAKGVGAVPFVTRAPLDRLPTERRR
jgi:cysteinyl-tRNA synthetase